MFCIMAKESMIVALLVTLHRTIITEWSYLTINYPHDA